MKSLAYLSGSRRPFQLGLALLVFSAFGCFPDPHPDMSKPRVCKENKACPSGYVCGADNFCCESSNGKTCNPRDASISLMDANGDALDGEVRPDGAGDLGQGGRSGWDDAAGADVRTIIGGGDGAAADASEGLDAADDVPMGGASGGATAGTGGEGGMGGATDPSGGTPTGGTTGGGGTTIIGGTSGTLGGAGASGTVGGATASGGVSNSGGTTASGGTSGGTGGQSTLTCGSSQKVCNGSCIPATSCCGGCSGNTPVCSNGECVAKTIGDACMTGTECATGVCSSGVCCNIACDGQCESCTTASNKGTCVPTTTPRTPCTSDGTVCGGACDGTAANRKKCVYPDANTLCGQAAQCNSATNQASTGEYCSGAGVCNSAETKSCAPYRCRTDGSPTCAVSCPAGQGVCGGTCVDIMSSAGHCGGSCKTCQGATPQCVAGNCVQCASPTDCSSYGNGAECSPNNTCLCNQPSKTNLVLNSSFETSMDSWKPSAGMLFKTDDADACPYSGSIRTQAVEGTWDWGSIEQCVKVTAGGHYYFGYHYKQESASGVMCRIDWYPGSTCSGSYITPSYSLLGNTESPFLSWAIASGETTAPASAGSAMIVCIANGTSWGAFDQVYLDPSSATY